jgi:hypothetical protein
MGLRVNTDDFLRIYHGLHSPRRESRAGSRELLEHLVMPSMREPLLALIDDLYEPAATSQTDDGDENDETFETTIGEMLDSGIESLSCFAAAQIRQLDLRGLSHRLERTRALSVQHTEVLTWAQRHFEANTGPERDG